MNKLRILITVDPEIPVPPTNYGGIERIADGLIHEYTRLGHQVFLLAHPESTCHAAKAIIPWKGKSSENRLDTLNNALQLIKIVNRLKPEIIHSFSRLLYLWPTFLFTKVKAVMTYQREISNKTTYYTNKLAGNKIWFTACGEHTTKNLAVEDKFLAIHNFTDTAYFTDDATIPKEYLMYLGRIQDIKGTREAIEVAKATKQKLIIAGNIHPGHEAYFRNEVEPHFSNPLIEYVGPINDEQKLYYLRRSKAFLFPIKWEEPFGIVMAEAMACGTPVIGFRRGSVPEVVKEGVNGNIVEDVDGMINAVKSIEEIDRIDVRKDCEERFSQEVIAAQYHDYFNNILSGK